MARSRIWEMLKKAAKDVDQHLWTRAGPHGAAEISAALFTGSGYVMYGQAGPAEEQRPQEQAAEQKPTLERRGRSR